MNLSMKKILSFYESENAGVLTHLTHILNHGDLSGTGKMVILPVDQGFEHGPVQSFSSNPEAYDPTYHFRLASLAGCNAYAAPFGFLQAGAKEFAGKIPLILKINSSDSLYKNSNKPIPALTSSIDQALELGCVGVGFTIYPGSESRKRMYEEVAQASEYAKKYGLVVVIWSYPRGKGVSKQGETGVDVIAYAAHIAAQIGAHIIKVKPPQNFIENEFAKETFQKNKTNISALFDRVRIILQSAFNGKRIVIFSGGPAKEKSVFLNEVRDLAHGGSFGSIVGRNAFKRPFQESIQLLKAVMKIYKEHVQ